MLILTKGKRAIALGQELIEEKEEIADEDAPLVLVQCVNEEVGYKFKEPKNFIDLYTTVSSYFETLTEQETEELWETLEDCVLKYEFMRAADRAQFEDLIQTSNRDRALFIANCFREQGYEKVPDPNYFNREVNLDAYIDENWELREDDPLVQTWQSCEDKLPEDLKEEWDE